MLRLPGYPACLATCVTGISHGTEFKDGFRVDLLVEQSVVVELKAIEKLAPLHSTQLLGYLRLMNLPVGPLINFGEASLENGLHRIVNRYRPGE
ncbi:MAG TPA: GxxExxY protein [Longimicrobium sp.]|nr:GxxExxY protein [Longimicrobium sp.]